MGRPNSGITNRQNNMIFFSNVSSFPYQCNHCFRFLNFIIVFPMRVLKKKKKKVFFFFFTIEIFKKSRTIDRLIFGWSFKKFNQISNPLTHKDCGMSFLGLVYWRGNGKPAMITVKRTTESRYNESSEQYDFFFQCFFISISMQPLFSIFEFHYSFSYACFEKKKKKIFFFFFFTIEIFKNLEQ